jgi:hypothetical protein
MSKQSETNPGHTPVRNIRIPDGLWDPALSKAKEEGRTITDVISRALHRYLQAPTRKRDSSE